MQFHEVVEIFPQMSDAELDELAGDILKHGQREPIRTHQGTIIDGRNRYLACKRAGIEPEYAEWSGGGSLLEFVISLNLHRRHLTVGQKAMIADDIKPKLAAEAEKRMLAGKKLDPTPNSAEGSTGEARDKAGELFGIGHTAVDQAGKLKAEAPDLADDVRAGKTTLHKADNELKKRKNRARLEDITVQEAKAAEGVFDVIVIDPPWPMTKIDREVAPNQVDFDYPTMSIDELKAFSVPAADDCHVWLWTTQRFLPAALVLLGDWGLKYVCTFVWHKPGGFQAWNLPQYNCEFVLYARRGAPQFLDTKAFNTCFDAPRGKHSEKPEAFYDVVRRVTGGRRLDMFNRRLIDGFTGWGKEAK